MINIIDILKKSFIKISKIINETDPFKLSSINNDINSSGDLIKYLDYYSNSIIKENLLNCPNVKAICSEEENELIYTNNINAKYLVCYDPIDGSNNIDVNICIGSIFSIYKFSQDNNIINGRNIVAAGYCLYGSSTQLIIAIDTVKMYILNNDIFNEIKNNIVIKRKGNIYSINESYKYIWIDNRIKKYIDILVDNKYSARWVGSLVADAHRTLLKGGVFLYPANIQDKYGKIRLIYEAYSLAYIFEKCNGKAIDGNTNILDIEFPSDIHQKTPIILCGLEEYKLFSSISN